MKKNAFKSETARIRKAAADHLAQLEKKLDRQQRPATRGQKKKLKAYRLVLEAVSRFERAHEGSTQSFEALITKDARIAYETLCKAQAALLERARQARKNKGDPIIDRALGNPDGKGGFKPLTPKQYDAIIKMLSKPPLGFEHVYFGYQFGWSSKDSEDVITSGEGFARFGDANDERYPPKGRKILRNWVRVWPAFVGASPERQALTFMHEYIGHGLAKVQDGDKVWEDKKLKGNRYLKYELDPTAKEIEDFYNQKGRIKRLYIGDTWAHAANEALKAAEQEKRPPTATRLRMPGKAIAEMPDFDLIFRKKGASGGQFRLRVISRLVEQEDDDGMLLSGWQLDGPAPKNHCPLARFGSIAAVPYLKTGGKEPDMWYNLNISTIAPQTVLEQVRALLADPEAFTEKIKETSTATPERPYGTDVFAILALPDGIGLYDLFERDTPLKLKVVGAIYFEDGPSKGWQAEYQPLTPAR